MKNENEKPHTARGIHLAPGGLGMGGKGISGFSTNCTVRRAGGNGVNVGPRPLTSVSFELAALLVTKSPKCNETGGFSGCIMGGVG
jgi:hypothetical protein